MFTSRTLLFLALLAALFVASSAQSCVLFSNCDDCVGEGSGNCGWCESTDECLAGNSVGPGGVAANCTEWFYDNCLAVDCFRFTSCSTCLRDPFCGWCESTDTCVEGLRTGPVTGTCNDYIFDRSSCPATSTTGRRTSTTGRRSTTTGRRSTSATTASGTSTTQTAGTSTTQSAGTSTTQSSGTSTTQSSGTTKSSGTSTTQTAGTSTTQSSGSSTGRRTVGTTSPTTGTSSGRRSTGGSGSSTGGRRSTSSTSGTSTTNPPPVTTTSSSTSSSSSGRSSSGAASISASVFVAIGVVVIALVNLLF